jgi:hypothetical protein
MIEPPRGIAFVLDLSERTRALAVAEQESAHRERAEAALRETEEQAQVVEDGGAAPRAWVAAGSTSEFGLNAPFTEDPLRQRSQGIFQSEPARHPLLKFT